MIAPGKDKKPAGYGYCHGVWSTKNIDYDNWYCKWFRESSTETNFVTRCGPAQATGSLTADDSKNYQSDQVDCTRIAHIEISYQSGDQILKKDQYKVWQLSC